MSGRLYACTNSIIGQTDGFVIHVWVLRDAVRLQARGQDVFPHHFDVLLYLYNGVMKQALFARTDLIITITTLSPLCIYFIIMMCVPVGRRSANLVSFC